LGGGNPKGTKDPWPKIPHKGPQKFTPLGPAIYKPQKNPYGEKKGEV